jgi:YVTN family beta-propeller protein
MKLNKLFLGLLAGSLFLASCSDDDSSSNTPLGNYDNGVLILNQGGFGVGNASVSYLSNDMMLENNIFSGVNGGAVLGDVGQDIGLIGDLAYIVLNNSAKIEIVNRYTFQRVGTISTGLNNPRYIAFSDGKAFVTNWGNGGSTTEDYVAVIDLQTNLVTANIPVAEGPERIVANNGKLYVAHAGGYGFGHSVTVINAANNTVVTSIPVGDVPNSLDIEDNKLYVLSGGQPSWAEPDTTGKLQVIDMANNTVTSTMTFGNITHPANLIVDGNTIYYTVDSGVYKMDRNASTLPATPLFTTTAQGAYGIYSLALNGDRIYLGDAGDYNSNGKVYVYSLAGQLQNTSTVGVIPAGFYFN